MGKAREQDSSPTLGSYTDLLPEELLPEAAVMRETAGNARTKFLREELREISRRINAAAVNGDTVVIYHSDVSSEVKAALLAKGYTLHDLNDTLQISWTEVKHV